MNHYEENPLDGVIEDNVRASDERLDMNLEELNEEEHEQEI